MAQSKVSCDVCARNHPERELEPLNLYVDGKTQAGPWANMCSVCFSYFGVGVGTGLGQIYRWNEREGKYVKIGG